MVTLGRNLGLEWPDEYCRYLNGVLGIASRRIDDRDGEWIPHSLPWALNQEVIGSIRFSGSKVHQLDLLRVNGKGKSMFHHLFVVQAPINRQSEDFKCCWRIEKPFSLRGKSDFVWKEGPLAEDLSLDLGLSSALASFRHYIQIKADKEKQSVTLLFDFTDRPDYLTQEQFQAIDRIAEHILHFSRFGQA